ncbi:MAG: UDP-2,4-diacetamido-2,4,6-trideoxy-beta-L-altropyranose hydrolase [Sulfurimonas sp.]|jgi:UDP-2,4-diacetamido-2,4,6-trideoxy-beta-L-altropyranose hydrolase|uniref:UDP-2,4-diacetamido-2,4, 6-trideoxy-beta-L-altropyranose hydrolase n=1 Tax=unclassified Sulfurimonas TaxID=2623549 RepID=UPI0008B7180C|nr:UDP-2,4-diacetamido-2,4,6-trideoxy-beta-L-altropyranose hydrolase [Sulfurimonas sp. RIFOXYB12_FULL_35_9]MBS4068871.1 UDP-2,4-diacetamido-2,4,6-trideoxy-beta-L-altropyranose hydrolase [Sulfurimonas sp.]OHE03441.1 MAG: UDP-2,4-diacetamido-2,4,6-trideoxy-beta-L-altropyranose hydrolase [Sulfurimonas sp. RIFOXYB12_FULL_35_9]
MKNILIRADSSSIIGTGHVMRDLVLAKEFNGDNVTFASQDLEGNINHKIIESGYKLDFLKSNEIEELSNLIKKESIELIVIDCYAIDAEYEKELKIQNPTLKILSLDDTYEKHHCDILLNHNIYADAKKYKNLVPKSCELRCGEKFTLIRDEFIREKAKKPYKSKEKKIRVFLAMGGADTQNLNPKILKVLKKFNHIAVHVVTTTANKNLKELKKYIKNKKWVTLHVNTNKMAKLLRKSDFAIITPSVTANEVCFMQKPFIAIKTADNQKYMYKFLKKNGYDVMNKFNTKKLSCYLLTLKPNND